MLPSHYLAVRVIHLLVVGAILGGSAALWLVLRIDGSLAPRVLAWFEAVFWGLAGLVVFTGLGNLVTAGVPVTGTERGTAFALKLGCILLLAFASLVRTTAVFRLTRGGSDGRHVRLRWLYALTAWGSVVIVSLAGVLAHGY